MRKNWKKLLSCALAFLLVSADALAVAEAALELPRSLERIEAEAFAGVDAPEKFIVPEGTTEIGPRAFADISDVEFVLPASVKKIAADAFEGCANSTVTAPAGSYANRWWYNRTADPADNYHYEIANGEVVITGYKGGRKAVIPALIEDCPVVEIGDSAMSECYLDSITVPEGIERLGPYAFSYNYDLAEIVLPSTLREVGEDAFTCCDNLQKVVLPDGLETIGDGAFSECYSLRQLHIPAGVTQIGGGIFYRSSDLVRITVDPDNTAYTAVDGVLFTADMTKLIQYPAGRKGTAYTVPAGVKTIGEFAFNNCGMLLDLILPEGVQTLEHDAFSDAGLLKNVYVPQSVSEIGEGAFSSYDDIVIYGVSGSAIEAYANYWDITFIEGEIPANTTTPAADFDYIAEDGHIVITGYHGDVGLVILPDTIDGLPVTDIRAMDSIIVKLVIPASVTHIDENAFEYFVSTFEVAADSEHFVVRDDILYTADGKELIRYADGREDQDVEIPDGVEIIRKNAFRYADVKNVTIPDSVYRIGAHAFNECGQLQQVVIPDSVTEMGDYAFYGCSRMQSAEIGSGVKQIPQSAFAGCYKLQEIELPDGLEEIAGGAFASCESMREFTIPASVKSIGSYAFDDCYAVENFRVESGSTAFADRDGVLFTADMKTLIVYPLAREQTEYTVPAGVTEIAQEAFEYVQMQSLVLPSGLQRIGDGAFRGMDRLKSIRLPDSVTDMGEYAFAYCYDLEEVVLSKKLKSIADGVFRNCNSLMEITIPDSVSAIGEYAFMDCESLFSVDIGAGVTAIGSFAFESCGNLVQISMLKSVTDIGENVFGFYYDESTVIYTVSDADYVIGKAADEGWTVEIGALPEAYASPASSFAYEIVDGEVAITAVNDWTVVIIPSKINGYPVTTIREGAAEGIRKVYVPASVDTIEEGAFADIINGVILSEGNPGYVVVDQVLYNKDMTVLLSCAVEKPLSDYEIPDSVVRIGNKAFWNMDQITGATFSGENLREIGDEAFHGCYNMRRLTIGGGVESIGKQAFAFCEALEEVTIGAQLKYIGERAFYGCYSLAELTVDTDNTGFVMVDGVLYTADMKKLIICPAGRTNPSYVMPEGVQEIAPYAFSNCYKLSDVTVCEGVKALPEGVFEYCESLLRLVLPASLESISEGAFPSNSFFEVTAPEGSFAANWAAENGYVHEDCVMESSHPYEPNSDETWTYTHPESAYALKLSFSQRSEFEWDYDYLDIIDAAGNITSYTGNQLAGLDVYLLGGSFELNLRSDSSMQEFGFRLLTIEAVGKEHYDAVTQ